MSTSAAVSVVIPVLNGHRWLPRVLEAVRAECRNHPFEILVIDDGSTDGSLEYLRAEQAAGRLRLLDGSRRGPSAAVNLGIREARYPFVCQIDQDVIVGPGWMETLLSALKDPDVAAAQGRYTVLPDAGFWARIMGRDLEQRYDRIATTFVDHVCTGNTIYRTAALHQVGLLDENLGYGADNDLSYRLVDAGHRLAFCPGAQSVHVWRERWTDYLRQQFGVGYGRLDVIHRHPARVTGDKVSGAGMILHAAAMSAAIGFALLAGGAFAAGRPGRPWLAAALVIVGLLAVERLAAGIAGWRRHRDPTTLAFPIAHLARDAAWSWAIVVWCWHRLARRKPSARHSMRLASVPATSTAPANSRRRPLEISQSTARMRIVVPALNHSDRLVEDLAILDAELRELRRSGAEPAGRVMPDAARHGGQPARPRNLP